MSRERGCGEEIGRTPTGDGGTTAGAHQVGADGGVGERRGDATQVQAGAALPGAHHIQARRPASRPEQMCCARYEVPACKH